MMQDCDDLMPLSFTESKRRRELYDGFADYQNTNM